MLMVGIAEKFRRSNRSCLINFEIQPSRMKVILSGIFVFLSCSLIQAATEEFPKDSRGLWVDSKETCDNLRMASPSSLHNGQRWLKITATDVLGTTQGRFLRQIPARVLANGDRATFAAEIQMVDEFGLIVELDFVGSRYLSETMMGAHADRSYIQC